MTALGTFVTDPHRLDERQRELYDAITGGPRSGTDSPFEITDDRGALRGPFAAMLLAPDAGDAVQRLGGALRFQISLDPRLREIAILVVAHETGSTFEWTAHALVARRIGLSEDDLACLRGGDADTLSHRELRCVALVRALTNGDPVDAADFLDDFTAAELYELSSVAGYYRMLATQIQLFGLDEHATPRRSPIDGAPDATSEGLQ